MSTMRSRITSLTTVYSTVYSGADQRKHQSSMSPAFVWGIHQWPLNSPHKRPVTWKMFPFDDVIIKELFVNTPYLDLFEGYCVKLIDKNVWDHQVLMNRPVSQQFPALLIHWRYCSLARNHWFSILISYFKLWWLNPERVFWGFLYLSTREN